MATFYDSKLSRRAALRSLLATGAGVAAARWLDADPLTARLALAQVDPTEADRLPARSLKIASPAADTVPEFDLRRNFGAVGDGVRDDGPSMRSLAEAVNTGRIPSRSVIRVPAGRYRIVGNDSIIFERPVIVRGDGPAATFLQPEYSTQRSRFLAVRGYGMYTAHTSGLYGGRREENRYPSAPFSAVLNTPRRGETTLTVEQPWLFGPGSQVYLLCDDYGPEITYATNNRRSEHFLLKQHFTVREVSGSNVVLDAPLRDDFAGASPRLYQWRPVVGFGLEHLSVDDRSTIPASDEVTTFTAIQLDGAVDSWIWNVRFLNSTSVPLSITRSRRVVVSEAHFDGARHVGAGGNGYLPALNLTDDSLIEYTTIVGGRHALICNYSCWGNVFRYNRVLETPNTETHGEYNVANLYLHNDARDSWMGIGGGGVTVHAHDGPHNELRGNCTRQLRVLKSADRQARLLGNWQLEAPLDNGLRTVQEGNVTVPAQWDLFPYAALCGADHTQVAEIATPDVVAQPRVTAAATATAPTTATAPVTATATVSPSRQTLASGHGWAAPTIWRQGQTQSYSVTLTNMGTEIWRSAPPNQIRLSVRFGAEYELPGAGSASDQRFSLPFDVAPGESVTLTISVTAPSAAGTYLLRQRLVNEDDSWVEDVDPVVVTVSPATGA